MYVNEWNSYYLVFKEIDSCFMPYLDDNEIERLKETELFYKHYLFYVLLFILVKTGSIPYRKKIPSLKLLIKKEYQRFCMGYDKEFFDLVIGIIKGCGFELLMLKHVRYPAYENGKSTYFDANDKLRNNLLSFIERLPLEVSLCWREDAKTSAELCSQMGFYMDTGLTIIVYTHSRYHCLIDKLKKYGAVDNIKNIDAVFQSCQQWFLCGIQFPKVKVNNIIYSCEVMPLTISTPYYGDVYSGKSSFFNKMLIFNAVKLALLIEKMEIKYNRKGFI